jgi:prepilin-type N-terminal cleavage/methylation domain-containing protein
MTSHADPERPLERAAEERGFSFIELIVVMGAMGMLMGLAVGYLNNIGQATFLAQARAMLSETAYRCINASSGGGRASMTIREVETDTGGTKIRVGAQVAGVVLSAQFETLDFVSQARTPDINGEVELHRGGGRYGNSARFKGGYMELGAQSSFAMTEGMKLDVWVKPEPASRVMTILKGGESYEVLLVQDGDSNAYNVRVIFQLQKMDDSGRAVPFPLNIETRGGVLMGDGRWSRLGVSFDGIDTQIKVNGLDVSPGDEPAESRGEGRQGDALKNRTMRIVVPETGVVPVSISSGDHPFYGEMDALHLSGVFRSEELERDLPGAVDTYEVLYPALPVRIEFANGALDPDVHNGDQVIRILDRSNPEDPPLRLTIGMYGVVSADYEQPGEVGPEAERDPSKAVPK